MNETTTSITTGHQAMPVLTAAEHTLLRRLAAGDDVIVGGAGGDILAGGRTGAEFHGNDLLERGAGTIYRDGLNPMSSSSPSIASRSANAGSFRCAA